MKVSLVQMNSVMDVDKNFTQAIGYIKEAASLGARLILLPEMFLCLGVKNQSQLAREHFSKDSQYISELKRTAQALNVFIVAGSLPLPVKDENHKVHAACLVFSPEGEIAAQYNKMHLFDVNVNDEKGSYRESDTFLGGDKPEIVDIDGNQCGLSICYDLRFPELFNFYMQQGCTLLCVPSAFTYETGKAHWLTLLKARAVETQCFILAANQAGIHEDGRRTFGHSVVIDPTGNIIAQMGGDEVGIVSASLDFTLQANTRHNMPLLQHKHAFFKSL